MSKRAFIILGVESCGNHAVVSLLSKMTIGGLPVIGTDLAGLDGCLPYRCHNHEVFDPVWRGTVPLEDVARGKSFVTGRSMP